MHFYDFVCLMQITASRSYMQQNSDNFLITRDKICCDSF